MLENLVCVHIFIEMKATIEFPNVKILKKKGKLRKKNQ